MCYGDFDFELIEARSDGADMRTDLRADRPILERRSRCSNADGPILVGVRLPLNRIDIAVLVLRSVVAARVGQDKPCRVTTLCSRMS